MLQLRGSLTVKLDEKGRIKLPSGFRSEISQQHGNEFYITSLTGECVRLYPFAVWDELEKKISELKLKLNLGDKTDYKSQKKREV